MKSMRQKIHIENEINIFRIFLLHLPKLQKCIALLISLTAEAASEVQELLSEGRESCYHTHSNIYNVFMKAFMFS